MLVYIDDGDFCGGIVVDSGWCVRAPPRVHWFKGMRWEKVRDYLIQQKWKYQIVEGDEHA